MTDLAGAAAADEPVNPARLAGLLETIEHHLLGDAPSLTRIEVAERAGVPLEMAVQLWRLLGFATNDDDEVAFTEADVDALRASHELTRLGILGEDSQAALVRTWGRSFARLAEWETTLLANVAGADEDPEARLAVLAAEVLPRVESLQTYIWRRHLASASSRLVSVQSGGTAAAELAVCFVDIVGYTSRSKSLDESELVAWLEGFEDTATGIVVDRGGRIIKTIGDEILFVADDPAAAAEIALLLTERGEDPDDPFPSVRAGDRPRRGGQPARGRLRAGREHRLPADLAGAARHGAGRPAAPTRCSRAGSAPTRTTTRPAPEPPPDDDEHAVPLPPDAAQLGEGVLAPAVVGAAPGVSAAAWAPRGPSGAPRRRSRRTGLDSAGLSGSSLGCRPLQRLTTEVSPVSRGSAATRRKRRSPAAVDGGHDNDRAEAKLRERSYRHNRSGRVSRVIPDMSARRVPDSAQGDLPVGQARAGGALLGGEVGGVGERLAQVGGEPLRRLLERLRAGAERQVPDRRQQAVRAEHADEARALDEVVPAGRVQPGERVEQLVLGLGHHPAQVLLGADVRSSTPPRRWSAGPSGWRRRWPARARRPCRPCPRRRRSRSRSRRAR